MTWLDMLLVGIGLAMDASAVAAVNGMSMRRVRLYKAAIIGLAFGFFQGLMPLIGYLLGVRFESFITSFDHWIAFVLLALIGLNMIKESREESECLNDAFDFKTMLPLALATSIDALAVGVTFAFLQVNIAPAVSFIGVITFVLSALGVKMGHVFGSKYKSRAELAGGVILILMGIKILIEHLTGGA